MELFTRLLLAVLVLGALWIFGSALRLRLLVVRLRRHGESLAAEVVDTDASQRLWNGGRVVRPVVRFTQRGREHRSTLRNCTTPRPVGTEVRIAAGPDDGDAVVSLDDDNSVTALLTAGGFLLVAAGIAAWLWYLSRGGG